MEEKPLTLAEATDLDRLHRLSLDDVRGPETP